MKKTLDFSGADSDIVPQSDLERRMMAGMERIITRSNKANIEAMESRLLGKIQETVRDVEQSVDSLRAELQAERLARQDAIDKLRMEMDQQRREARGSGSFILFLILGLPYLIAKSTINFSLPIFSDNLWAWLSVKNLSGDMFLSFIHISL